MKILRPAAAVAAMTASFAFSAHSQAADADATNVSPQAASVNETVDSVFSVATTYEQIRTDVSTAEFTGDEMLGRIDSLVSRIDELMKAPTQNATNELTQLRNASLQMRGEVVEFLKGNGTQLVQFQSALPTAESIMSGTAIQNGGQFAADPGFAPAPSVAPAGGGFNSVGSLRGGGGGGVSSGGGGGMLGGGGSFGMLGAAAAAASIGLSDDDDTNFSVGTVASQAGM
ncbi:hypothetical protein LF1_01340 [Rubripirellula obstinata]|uniref:Uncharacterized protein n=1 Tax=Rubripirellula obstinata TaxID=406547 RepID=A0A5B1CAR7_9BACT|nr:hypothetical protein [Rubripirellula obstinata]KAA1257646.1 hypothetical protein LF1_01340 [Rubripirellula obstinata]